MNIEDENETDLELLKISTELMDLTLKWVEKGATPMMIAGCLMATASRMYQEQLSEEEWIALLDTVAQTTTSSQNKETLL